MLILTAFDPPKAVVAPRQDLEPAATLVRHIGMERGEPAPHVSSVTPTASDQDDDVAAYARFGTVRSRLARARAALAPLHGNQEVVTMPDLNTTPSPHLDEHTVDEHTPGSVPPFAVVRQGARRRTRLRAALSVLGALLVVAGIVTVAVSWADHVSPPATTTFVVDGPPPSRITVNGQELAGEAELGSVWIDDQDSSVLVVEAGFTVPPDRTSMLGTEGGYCVPYTMARILGQDEQSVQIAAYAYRPPHPPTTKIACPDVALPAKRHFLQLGAPLDGRSVLHGATPVDVVDLTQVLTPSYLPAGYRQPGTLTVGYGPLSRRVTGYVEWRYDGAADDFFYIEQVDPAAELALNAEGGQPSLFGPEEAFDVVARPTVRGHEGLLFTYGPGLRCVRWRESPELAVVICSHGQPQAPLGQGELLTIAQSLRRGQ